MATLDIVYQMASGVNMSYIYFFSFVNIPLVYGSQ